MRRILFSLFCLAPKPSPAQIVINEIMQSNIDCIMDDLNEFPDSWVELYNDSSVGVELSGFRLGLSDNPAEAWTLPKQSIPAHGYVIVYCDKNETAGKLHAPFRIESGKGGAVHLFRGTSLIQSVTDIPKQPTPNISYTRYGAPGNASSAESAWAYASLPTPRTANDAAPAKGVLGLPEFSREGGIFRGAPTVIVELSLPADAPAGTVIRYTKDGSEPTTSSPIYSNPIVMTSTSPLTAKLFCEGWASSRGVTHSYIIPDHDVTLPIVSIVGDDRYFNDSQIGIMVDGKYSSSRKNYEYDWRRPINLEVFMPDGSGTSRPAFDNVINQLCEGRVMGGASRSCPLKSMALYANKRFGEKNFKCEFFPDQRPGTDKFKSFILRNAGNDFDYLYLRDAIIQRNMAAHTDIDWQAWRPAVVYINGKYKGILNIRDRSTEDNIVTYYDGLEDFDMIKNHWELKRGSWDNFNAFKDFYNEHGHTYDEFARWIDLDEYIAIMAANLYYGNFDFPGNNIVFWRPRTPDGRWRVIMKDTDYTLGIYDGQNTYDMLQWINNADYDGAHSWANQWEHTRLFRRLMEDLDFRRTFLERCAIYMGDFLNERGTRASWDACLDLISGEWKTHRKLFNPWWPNYQEETDKARRWLSGRTNIHYRQLASYYSMGTALPLVINAGRSPSTLQGVRFCFNGVQLSEGSFQGRFYKGNTIALTSRPATEDDAEAYRLMKLRVEGAVPDYFTADPEPQEVVGWKVITISTIGTQTVHEYEGPNLTLTMPDCASVQIFATLGAPSGIAETSVDAASAAASAIYDLQGRASAGARPSGIYLKPDAKGTYRKVVIR